MYWTQFPPPKVLFTSPVSTRQMIVLSGEALAIKPLSRPSEVTSYISRSCPVSVFKHSPLLTLQMRTVLSSEALARRPLPDPTEATLTTGPSCPVSVFKHSPLLTLQMRIVLSPEALAMRPLAGPNEVTHKTFPSCPVRTAFAKLLGAGGGGEG